MTDEVHVHTDIEWPRSYILLTRMAESILAICERHNIKIFFEFGTLIGFARHNGIIPWDHDFDFCIMNPNKEKFLEVIDKELPNEFYLDKDFYQDPNGCMWFSPKETDRWGGDVIFYEEKEDGSVHSLMSQATLDMYPFYRNYIYKKDELLPLKEVLFLGHKAYVPNKWTEMLVKDYMQWYKLPKKIPLLDAKFHESPIKPIPRYSAFNFAQLRSILSESNVPFIVPNGQMDFLNFTKSDFNECMEGQKTNFFCFNEDLSMSEKITAKEVLNKFKDKSLQNNEMCILPENGVIISREIEHFLKKKHETDKSSGFHIAFLLTTAPHKTPFHDKPPIKGGNWMKLCEGTKICWFVLKEDWVQLEAKGYSRNQLKHAQFADLLVIDNGYLFGKIYIDIVKAGDFIYFPESSFHSIITLDDSFAFVGHINP